MRTSTLTASIAALSLMLAGISAPVARGQNGIVVITVDTGAERHAINPLVYGLNYATTEQLRDLRCPLNRRGGNATTSYNWEQNVDNRAADYFFESLPLYADRAGGDADDFIAATKAGGAEPMIAVPTIGWVAKLGPGRSRLASFSVAKYGAQQQTDPFFADAGNGVRTNGSLVTGNDPNDASVLVDSAFQKRWVDHLVGSWGNAASGGVRYYCLDNEPSIWFSTHRDVHPMGPTMEEIRDLWIDYATKVKEADPGAVILGPEEWGYLGYIWSGADQQYAAAHNFQMPFPDRSSHQDMDYVPWVLGELHRHDTSAGIRTIDVLSVHYYPQGGEFGDDVSTAMQLRRNRSTRSLWDPAYVDETYINDVVRLVPRLHEWVASYYPGLQIGVTEYNWGAEGHINGATAQADVLGIFGREGLDLATRWTTPETGTPTYNAIKMYRNYDDAGGAFGDTSVHASSPNPDDLAVFAATRSEDGALTIVVVDKKLAGNQPVRIDVSNFAAGAAAEVWQLTASNEIRQLQDVAVTSGSITTTLPKQSITMLLVPSDDPAAPRVQLTSPNGGEKARAGETLAVAWTATGDLLSQDVEVSDDGGATYPTSLATGLAATATTFDWSIPATQKKGKHYRVRVVAHATDGSVGTDASDRDFRIKKAR